MRTSTTGTLVYHSSPWPGNHRAAPHAQEKLPRVLMPAWGCQGSHCHCAGFWGALLGISPEIMSEDIFQFTCCIITRDVAIWSMQNFYDSSIYFLPHTFQARSEYEWDKDWCGASPRLDKTFSGEEAFVSAPEAAAFQPGTCKVSQLFSSNLHLHVVKVVSQGAAAWGTARHPVWVLWFPARRDWRAGRSLERWYCHPEEQKPAHLHGKHITDFRKEKLFLGQIHALVQATLQPYRSLNWQSGGRTPAAAGAFCWVFCHSREQKEDEVIRWHHSTVGRYGEEMRLLYVGSDLLLWVVLVLTCALQQTPNWDELSSLAVGAWSQECSVKHV